MAERPLLLLVDLAALAFRCHYAMINHPITRADGMVTSALFGMSNAMLSILEEMKPDYVLCALDRAQATFRHKLYPDYKAHRPPCPEDLGLQLAMQEEFCESFGMAWDGKITFEADDLIGTYTTMAKEAGMEVVIFSGDKDFMQLLDEHTKMLVTHRGGEQELFTYNQVEQKLGIHPHQVVDYLALLGDASDNVPGAPGVGKVTATELLKEFGSIDNLLASISKVKKKGLAAKLSDNRELIALSKQLVTIDCAVPEVKTLSELAFSGVPLSKAKPFLEKMEFPRILARLHKTEKVTQTVAALDITQVDYQLFDQTAAFLDSVSKHTSDHWTMAYEGVEDVFDSIALSPQTGKALVLKQITTEDEPSLIEALTKLNISAYGLKNLIRLALRHNQTLELGHDLELQVSVLKPGFNTSLRELIEDDGTYRCLDLGKSGNRKRTYKDLSDDELKVYLGEQADRAHLIVARQQRALEEAKLLTVYRDLEMPLLKVIAAMEQRGVCVNVDKIKVQELEVSKELKELTDKICALAGEKFNVNSPKQLGVILFEKMKLQEELGLKKIKTTKTGFSTDITVLESIKAHPIGEALLRYRFLSKLNSTYLEALPKQVHPNTGFIHTTYHQNGTATGRLSSQNPNLQNIPMRVPEGARIREAFITSRSDRVMVSADYSQIELRILAHFSKDETMKEAFLSGHDIHSATAAKVFGISPELVTRQQRSSAKAVNFGLLYGMGPKNLSQQTGLTFAEAQKFIRAYFESFSSIQAFMEAQVQKARDLGYVTTLAGRKRSLPDLNASNGMLRNAAENMALNTPIQGSAADIIKWAMLRLHKVIAAEALPMEMVLQVHDELVLEVDREQAPVLMGRITQIMEDRSDLPEDFEIPLKVEIAQGENWLESH